MDSYGKCNHSECASMRRTSGYNSKNNDENIHEESVIMPEIIKIFHTLRGRHTDIYGLRPTNNTDDRNIDEELGALQKTANILMPCVKDILDQKICRSAPGYDKSSIRSSRGYVLNTDGRNINEEFGTKQIAGHTSFLMPNAENTPSFAAGTDDIVNASVTTFYEHNSASTVKKNKTANCMKRFQQEYNELMKQKNEAMRSTEYSVYHEVPEISSKPTFNENIEYDHADSILLNESMSTKHTGNEFSSFETVNKWEVTGFQEKHDDLMKGRNEKQPNVIEIRSPMTDIKQIKSCDSCCSCFSAESCKLHSSLSTESCESFSCCSAGSCCQSHSCFSAESLQLNPTICDFNPKKKVDMMKIANSGSNYEFQKGNVFNKNPIKSQSTINSCSMTELSCEDCKYNKRNKRNPCVQNNKKQEVQYFNQKENTFNKNPKKSKYTNKNCSKKSCEDCKCYHNDNDYNEYYMSQINERIDNAEHEYMIKKNSSVQKQGGSSNDKLLRMIEEINKDFKQIKELFMNSTKNNSSCDCNAQKMNQCNSMSAGEDITDNNIFCDPNTNIQNKYCDFQNSTKFEYNDEFERYLNKSQRTACSQDNIEFWCTNNRMMCNGQNLQQETPEGIYQIKVEDLYTPGASTTVHFFSWENQSICQCGMTYNTN